MHESRGLEAGGGQKEGGNRPSEPAWCQLQRSDGPPAGFSHPPSYSSSTGSISSLSLLQQLVVLLQHPEIGQLVDLIRSSFAPETMLQQHWLTGFQQIRPSTPLEQWLLLLQQQQQRSSVEAPDSATARLCQPFMNQPPAPQMNNPSIYPPPMQPGGLHHGGGLGILLASQQPETSSQRPPEPVAVARPHRSLQVSPNKSAFHKPQASSGTIMSLTSSELDATSSPRHTPHSLTRSLKLPAATAGEAPGHHHVSPTTMSKTHNQNMRTQQLTRRSSVTKVPPPVYPEPAMMNPRYLHILSKEPFNILQPGWRWNPREQSHELVYKCPCGGHVQMTWNLSPRSNVALLRHLDVNKTMKHAKYCEMMQNQRRNASPAAGNDPGY